MGRTYILVYKGRYIEALESALRALLQSLVNMVMVIGVSLVSDVWRTKFEAFHVGILLQLFVHTRRAKRELLSEMDTKQSQG